MPDARSSISKTRENLILVLLGLVGIVLFVLLYPRVQPAARLNISVDRTEAWAIAETYLMRSGFDPQGYTDRNVTFSATNSMESFLQRHATTDNQRALVEHHEPAAYWDLLYLNPDNNDRIRVRVGLQGDVFQCTRIPPEEMPGANLTQDAAQSIAQTFLTNELLIDWSEYMLRDARSTRRDARTDHTFTWEQHELGLGGSRLRLTATVQGDQVGSWFRDVQLPETFMRTYQVQAGTNSLFPFWQTILAILVTILALIVFALRFRAGEIGFRNGWIIGAVVIGLFLALGLNIVAYSQHSLLVNPNNTTARAVTYFLLTVNGVVTGLCVLVIWISGESLARETWPEKLKTFDGLFSRHYFFPDLGRSILRGFSLGLAELGLWYLVVWFFLKDPNVIAIINVEEEQAISAFLPFFYPLANGSLIALLVTSFTFLFSMSYLKKRIKPIWLVALIPFLLFSSVFATTTVLHGRWLTALAGLATGWLSFFFFLRYDLYTVFVGSFLYNTLPFAALYLAQSHPRFQIVGGMTLALLGLFFVYGYIARTRGKPLDEQAIQPRYVQYITERERLKMELDIARRAQLRMLPSRIPQPQGLDIAAFSEPAREVGGDYFDFFQLDENRIAIAIGDVSGKGMSAALYMTMLKGFLQSRVEPETSPRELLSHINRKFYSSAERSMFVTLLYAVIDLGSSTMTLARAGHNPLLIYRPTDRTVYALQPSGLGIGLEQGNVFDRVTENETFALRTGDTILFYTDGLTEARNEAEVEFGQERVMEIMKQSSNHSAEHLLQLLRTTYRAFINHRDPHDDLTCVVVKLT